MPHIVCLYMQYGSRTDLGYVVLQHDISDPHGLRSQVGSLRHTSTGWVRWASMFTWMVLERKLDHLLPGTCSTSFTCFYAAEIVSILGQGHLVNVSVCWNGTLSSQDKLQVLAFQACGPPWFKAWELLLTSEGVYMRHKLGTVRIPVLQRQCGHRTGRLKLVDFDAAMYVPEAWASVTFGVRHHSNKQKERHMIWEVRYTVYSQGFHGSHHHLILAGWGWCSCWSARKCRRRVGNMWLKDLLGN